MSYDSALKNFLYRMADDHLILGHRNSEWTGLGPMLEEDLAFSNMAQDKLGQSLALYEILQSLGEQHPDTVAFTRKVAEYHCCQYVEYPIGEYDYSLIRHFLFDHAAYLRFEMLTQSSCEPLAKLAAKVKGEIKYHVMHANIWIDKLGNGNEESHRRLQTVIDNNFNLALGIFETGEDESAIINEKIFDGEQVLMEKWLSSIELVLAKANLKLPPRIEWNPAVGGRKGNHTVHLQPLLTEMQEVFSIDPNAEW
ncbi:MAG: phenylacetate-CoA oxygenase subunit PaaC [Bacteroidetes bacterium]|nr:phenylacetate-CoA oxygenase subunit PaaC [Bacteroidota bacterium]